MKTKINGKTVLIAGIAVLILSFVLLGIKQSQADDRIGDEIRELQKEVISTETVRSEHDRRFATFYIHVTIDGKDIKLKQGHTENYPRASAAERRYSEGDIATVYEYNGEYSLTKSMFLRQNSNMTIVIIAMFIGIFMTTGGIVMLLIPKAIENNKTNSHNNTE